MLDLSLIIVSFNTEKLLKECIVSVAKNIAKLKYEIIIVDNDSTDKSVQTVKKLARKYPIKLIENKKNYGFAKANNIGIKRAKGKYVLLLNSDTKIKSKMFSKLLSHLDKDENIGALTCALEGPDGKLQGPGGYFPTLPKIFAWMTFLDDIPFLDVLIKPFHPVHANSPLSNLGSYLAKTHEMDWIAGTFFLIRKKVFDQIGGLSEDYFMYVEDVDLCWRIRKRGWKILYLPHFRIKHFGGASSLHEFPILSEYKGLKLFYKKHMPSWQYPVLKKILKFGALLRMVVFGTLKGKEEAGVYAKAFKIA